MSNVLDHWYCVFFNVGGSPVMVSSFRIGDHSALGDYSKCVSIIMGEVCKEFPVVPNTKQAYNILEHAVYVRDIDKRKVDAVKLLFNVWPDLGLGASVKVMELFSKYSMKILSAQELCSFAQAC